MEKAKKVLLLLMCAVLLVGMTIMGTVAYLTDTDTVTNTFTVGKVDITLQEYEIIGETGKKTENLVSGNDNIRMIPGREIQKEPVLTVVGGSEECYVRMFVKVTWPKEAIGLFNDQAYAAWFETNDQAGFDTNWGKGNLIRNGTNAAGGYGDGVEIFEFRYQTKVAKSDDSTKLNPLFTAITIPEELSPEQLAAINGSKIELIAQAIQAEGFTDAAAAFAAAGYPEGLFPPAADPETP